MQPLISAVIPVYNMAERLKYMVESLRNQDYTNLEVIICDDASTDGVGQYLEELLRKNYFSRTVVLHNSTNKGVSFSRNLGAKSAHGEYVNFLDADDLVEPNFFSSLYRALSENKSEYAACGYKSLDLKNNHVKCHYLKVPENASSEEILLGRLLNRYEISHCALLIKRSFLFSSSLFYSEGCSAGEDMEFLIRLLSTGARGAFIKDCLYTYVQYEQMGSRKNTRSMSKRIQRYYEHTEAQFREIECIKSHCYSKKVTNVVNFLMNPAAWQRRLSYYAMTGQELLFKETLSRSDVRSILRGSVGSAFYKPEVYFRSLAVLYLPRLYYKKYNCRQMAIKAKR